MKLWMFITVLGYFGCFWSGFEEVARQPFDAMLTFALSIIVIASGRLLRDGYAN